VDDSQQRLSPWQQQQQTQYAVQNVSVPVTVQASPTSSYTVGPAPQGDYGPMVPPGVADGMSAFFTNRCVTFLVLGGLAAFLLKKRS